MDHAFRGQTALDKSNYAAAIENYTFAIQSSPESPTYYIKRSTAYQRNSQSDLALSDAEKAVSFATKRAKRELIAQAQLRRGIALFQLGQFANSKFCLEVTKRLNDKEKSADIWIVKCEAKLKTLSEGDEVGNVTVQEVPDLSVEPPAKVVDMKTKSPTIPDIANEPAVPVSPASSQTPKEKVRHEWYQNNETVTINILAKGVPKDKATVDLEPTSVSISYPLDTGSSYEFTLDPLFASIDTDGSKFRILSTKIEITLRKQTQGQKWASLEGTEVTAPGTNEGDENVEPKSSGPAYPTSSRSGPKNWDKIAQSYQKPPEKLKEDGEKSDDGHDESDEKEKMYVDDYEDDGDPANAFFKKLYADADPDTQRAMMKSYQESGGTALSTNWEEVSKKTMEISPPEGMEAKKWEY